MTTITVDIEVGGLKEVNYELGHILKLRFSQKLMNKIKKK
jgi:hypothetical protein